MALEKEKPTFKTWKLFVFFAICVIFAAWGIISRAESESRLDKDTQKNIIPTVNVIKPKTGASVDEVVLPGRVEAWHEAPIFARTSGYVESWKADIGAHVKAGDVLALIDTPEVDSQERQAEADLGTAAANNALAQTTATRWVDLLKTDSVTKQETDEKTGDAAAKAAALASAKANVDRLKDQQVFKRIVAPFSGVISARNIDTGALINAGSGGAPEMFHIVDKSKLRVYVEVPQTYTSRLSRDMTVELHFEEYPGKPFTAKWLADASALDPATRTMTTQFEVDNKDELLLPGGFAEVHMKIPSGGDGLRVPISVLLYRPDGVVLATVDDTNHAHVKKVTLGRDFGTEVEILAGVTADENVINNPGDSLNDGEEVRISTPEDQKKNDDKQDGDKKDDDKKWDKKDDDKKSSSKDDDKSGGKDKDAKDSDSKSDNAGTTNSDMPKTGSVGHTGDDATNPDNKPASAPVDATPGSTAAPAAQDAAPAIDQAGANAPAAAPADQSTAPVQLTVPGSDQPAATPSAEQKSQ